MAQPIMPRIPNLPQSAWTPEVEEIFLIMVPATSSAKGSDFNVLRVLAHHPSLSGPFLRFNRAVADSMLLSPRQKEIAVLRVAWRSRSDYEWAQHMLSGLRAGLDIEDFKALMEEHPDSRWGELDGAIIQAADDLWRCQKVGGTAWNMLSASFSTAQIMDLLYLIGTYLALAGILNSAEVPLDAPVREQVTSLGLPMFSGTQAAV